MSNTFKLRSIHFAAGKIFTPLIMRLVEKFSPLVAHLVMNNRVSSHVFIQNTSPYCIANRLNFVYARLHHNDNLLEQLQEQIVKICLTIGAYCLQLWLSKIVVRYIPMIEVSANHTQFFILFCLETCDISLNDLRL